MAIPPPVQLKGRDGQTVLRPGTACAHQRLFLDATTAKERPDCHCQGDTNAWANIYGLDASGPLGTITAATTDLSGRLFVAASAKCDGRARRDAGPPGDVKVQSAMPLKFVTAAEWLDTGACRRGPAPRGSGP